jgi:hypothetical protein
MATTEHSNNGRNIFCVRYYNQDQLAAASVRELLGFVRCELLLLEAGSRGRGQFGNPEEGEHPLLEATIKQRQ